ncbi:NAD(P)-binding domain-containing protein, partial [Escherichia coli]
CATGTLWEPVTPELAGAGAFGGTIRHSVTYRSPDELRNKRVLVVGAGNSAVDIACDAARSARSVSLSMRRGYWFVPKFIGGEPTDVVLRRPS